MSDSDLRNIDALEIENKILLMGPPNVGKSVFFSEYTGLYAMSSNFTGTTVSYMEGGMMVGEEEYRLVDVPGTYTMEATSEAEEVAVRFVNSNPKAILFVLNATSLHGSLRLALELKDYGIPTVYALNLNDVAQRQGLDIDISRLSELLGSPVIPTIAVKAFNLGTVRHALEDILQGKIQVHTEAHRENIGVKSGAQYWHEAEEITRQVQEERMKRPSKMDRLGDAMIRPWPGIPIALVAILLTLAVTVGGGEFLRTYILDPIVENYIVPFFRMIFTSIIPPGIFQNILVGEYGIFVIAFEWIFALILPYVFIFYFVFTFLEDSGYLPRLAVLADNVMSKIGVQGGSIIHIMLAFGCSVPAIISTRTATTQKERLLVTTIICFSIPCISQTGAIISLTGSYSYWLLLASVLAGIVIFFTTATAANKILPGNTDPLVLEIPNLLIPDIRAYWTKIKTRMKGFLYEAEGPMLLAIVIAAVFTESGLLNSIAYLFQPIVSGWLGLPDEAVISLILGIVRREMAVAPLLALNLNPLQMFVGVVVSLLYLPCISVFAILVKEFNVKTAIMISIFTTITAIFVGGVINHIGLLFI